jgi:tetratricopeptide (TPR) repeat protein
MEGRFDEALHQILQARQLDPLSPSIMQALGWCYYQMRRFDDALTTYRSMLEAVPEFSYGLVTYAWSLRHTGSMEDAVLNAEKALEFSSGGQLFVAGVGGAYAAAGRIKEAHATLDRLEQMSAHGYVSPYHLAIIHLHLGNREEAIAQLQQAAELKDAWLCLAGS